MKIIIKGEPKEIAAFILKMQRRHDGFNKEDVKELTNVTAKRALGERVRGSKF